MRKKILIINANSKIGSLTDSLASAYITGAKRSGAEIQSLVLRELNLSLDYQGGKQSDETPKNILKYQELMLWAEHIVFIYPVWWGTYPALLQLFLEKTLLSGFAYKFNSKYSIAKLLKGRSARLIQTSGGPWWAAKVLFGTLLYLYPGEIALKKTALQFCGIRPVRITRFTDIDSYVDKARIKKIIDKVQLMGANFE